MLFGLGILSGIFYFSSSSFAQSRSGLLAQTTTIFKGALRDMLGVRTDSPALEIDLKDRTVFRGDKTPNSAAIQNNSIQKSGASNNVPLKQISSGNNNPAPRLSDSVVSEKNSFTAEERSESAILNGQISESMSSGPTTGLTETKPGTGIPICDFGGSELPNHLVLVNEVAWMGPAISSNDEWVELRNNSGEFVDLHNWQLVNDTGKLRIVFSGSDKLPAGSLYLMERGDDDTVPDVAANKIYMGAISNSGIKLRLFDSSCRLVDEVDASLGWSKLGGDNVTKNTLERNVRDFDWHTSPMAGGSPGRRNDDRIPPTGAAPINTSASSTADSGTASPSSTPSGSQDVDNTPTASTSTNQPQPQLAISEIMAGSDLGSDDEFIELANLGMVSADLTGWSIKKKTSSGSESTLVSAIRLEGKFVSSGRKFLIVNEGGYKGKVASDATWAKSNTLAYTNNALVLYDPNGNKIDEVAWTEIPKNQSYEKQGGSFAIQPIPNPQNSSQ
ncbi:MAG: lamin tail domain-containing protein [Candidatus Liptonbacteria bacterium]